MNFEKYEHQLKYSKYKIAKVDRKRVILSYLSPVMAVEA